MYSAPTTFTFGPDLHIITDCGCMQGDTLGGFAYCVGVHPLIQLGTERFPQFHTDLPIPEYLLYYDDTLFKGHPLSVVKQANITLPLVETIGPKNNTYKTKLIISTKHPPTADLPTCLDPNHPDIPLTDTTNAIIMGCPIGTDDYIRSECSRTVNSDIAKLRKMQNLPVKSAKVVMYNVIKM